ncbi:hypothetical protein DFR50_110141 [Roseiarcus fermentans]|uniref:Uncharacterized protein n=1 Tax=Roseiarcus fermentans TaxID=1473586 RepID=A0A366FJ22_9HYPH|nr:hypothetical protein DFR50_110141 [Roseiarcus fermentans]
MTRRRDRPRAVASKRPRRWSDQLLRRSPMHGDRAAKGRAGITHQAIVWTESPVRTPGKDRQASLIAGLWRAGRDQKSPVRRCFKSRPPWGGVRRFASGCRSSKGRLTGLLSRSPPTGTRPQARAYWATAYVFESSGDARGFLPRGRTIFRAGASAAAGRSSDRPAGLRRASGGRLVVDGPERRPRETAARSASPEGGRRSGIPASHVGRRPRRKKRHAGVAICNRKVVIYPRSGWCPGPGGRRGCFRL